MDICLSIFVYAYLYAYICTCEDTLHKYKCAHLNALILSVCICAHLLCNF